MHDDIGAERQRARMHRRGGGRIDREPGACAMRDPGRGGDVGDGPERVRRRLDPDELGLARPHRRLERREIVGLDEIDAQAPALGLGGEPAAQRPVHHPRRDDVVAGVERLEYRGRGRHAGGEEQRLGPVLEHGEDALGLPHRGVVGPAVDEARRIGVVLVADEGRGEMDRRHDRLGDGLDRPHRLDGEAALRPRGRWHGASSNPSPQGRGRGGAAEEAASGAGGWEEAPTLPSSPNPTPLGLLPEIGPPLRGGI